MAEVIRDVWAGPSIVDQSCGLLVCALEGDELVGVTTANDLFASVPVALNRLQVLDLILALTEWVKEEDEK